MNCDPQNLATQAACFQSCISGAGYPAVANYLLCQIHNAGGVGGIPTDPASTSIAADCTGNVIVSWPVFPAGTRTVEVWTSSDGITYALATTVKSPGLSATLAPAAIGSFLWVKYRGCTGANCAAFSTPIMTSGRVSDWVRRVCVNGAAAPSASTQTAMNTFDKALSDGAITNTIVGACCFVPDSFIAATTPLFVGNGNDPWTNNGIALNALTLSGLGGNGVGYLDTGINPATSGIANDGGQALYVVNNYTPAIAQDDFGGYDAGATKAMELSFSIQANLLGAAQGNFGTNFMTASNAGPVKGMLWDMGQNVGGTRNEWLFKANSSIGWTLITSGNVGGNGLWPSVPMFIFARNQNGVAGGFSTKTISFAAVLGFQTTAQGQTFWNAVQALRTALGGGFV